MISTIFTAALHKYGLTNILQWWFISTMQSSSAEMQTCFYTKVLLKNKGKL